MSRQNEPCQEYNRLPARARAPRVLATVILLLLLVAGAGGRAAARERAAAIAPEASPGLPFTEDFGDDTLRDPQLTDANWSTEEEALVLAWRQNRVGAFGSDLVGADLTADVHVTAAVALGDVDGDGDLDLVAGNYGERNRLYLNNGSADPWNGAAGTDIGAGSRRTYAVVLGDVDGDGDLDLVAGNYGERNQLYLNNGSADPWNGVAGSDIGSDSHLTQELALGDVDGDGDLDLVAANYGQRNRLYRNNGSADPWSGAGGIDITTDTHDTLALALADVDGDGDLDLIAGNYADPNRLYVNNGTTNPWSAAGTDVSPDAGLTHALALGDVDGDGDLDLVAGNLGVNRLYLNNGTADPWNGVGGTDIGTGSRDTYGVTLGDVDGDGDLDLVAGNLGFNRLYLNNGTADPWDGVGGTQIAADSHDTPAVALGDVEGDGDLDLVAGNWDQPNRLYLNDSSPDPWHGVAGTDVTADVYGTYEVALGDVDGDGDLDLVAANDPVVNMVYLNNGSADPWSGVSARAIGADYDQTWSLALGDVDGDGDLDFLAGNVSRPIRLYRNNGSGDPWNGVGGIDISASNDALDMALGDVDGDGDLDLVAFFAGRYNFLFLNNGTANPWNGVAGIEIAGSRGPLALGDVDGDGDLDLVARASGANRLYLNNGTADPWNGVAGTQITADNHATGDMALGDVDGDGDLDLVTGNGDQRNRLYLNNGTADPWSGIAGSDITADAHATNSVSLGDVDGDGDLDLVAGNINQPNRLYLNNGSGAPWSEVSGTDISADTQSSVAVPLGDVDGDGDLDLVAGNFNDTNRLYLNRGAAHAWGGVHATDVTIDAHTTRAVAVGDVDGDGDLDLVAGNDGVNRLYRNDGVSGGTLPWSGSGANITTDNHNTYAVALGDVDRDGDLDLVAGNSAQPNRLYLNNGTADPWNGVAGINITTDSENSYAVALGDVDGDGDLDLVVGNVAQPNRLYLNNGTADPWNGASGTAITADNHYTWAAALGDVDGDGDLDLVAGNLGSNRLYLNNGTADPWNGVAGTTIAADTHSTVAVALGDVDGDGDLDLVAGNNGQPNRLYLNNGTADPWNGAGGTDAGTDTGDATFALALGDVDADGDLDLVAGNYGEPNRIYHNYGSQNPWSSVAGTAVGGDSHNTLALALVDVDGDGALDLIAGNSGQRNRLYRRLRYHTAHGSARSLRVDAESEPIARARLTAMASLPPNTGITYWLSNDGGGRWIQVQPGAILPFPTAGTDLRWRAELHSLSPALTPRINQLTVDRCPQPVAPAVDIGLAGSLQQDVLLTWTDNSANAGYNVYRNGLPYFTPGPARLLDSLPAHSLAYIDSGAAGEAAGNNYYLVRSRGSCGDLSSWQNRAGVFHFPLASP